ncbi:hypothetical protein D3C78_1841540 [compost metagenome]
MHRPIGPTRNKTSATGSFHSVQSHCYAIHVIAAAAFDDGEHAFAPRTGHVVPHPSHGAAVEVGLFKAF